MKTGFSFQLMKVPMVSLGGSLFLGGLIGLVLTNIAPRARNRQELFIIILGTAFLTSELARLTLKLSPLLINITIGFVLVNLCPVRDRLFEAIQGFELPIYITFFTLQGSQLDVAVLGNLGLVGFVYILSRGAGKILGPYLGAYLSGASRAVRNYTGFGMFPQAGIAIGMITAVQREPTFAHYAPTISTIVLSAILVNELIGPVVVKLSLDRVGESRPARVRKKSSGGGKE
ncbi:MAG: hypothetical protein V3T35_04890, partial [Spirochaetia bacterium]